MLIYCIIFLITRTFGNNHSRTVTYMDIYGNELGITPIGINPTDEEVLQAYPNR